MQREATAVWSGGLKSGNGTVTGASGAFNQLAYSYRTRFENERGTNPEELIAAAHAGCFSMALSAQLERNGFTPDEVRTSARVSLEQKDGGWAITRVELDLNARVPGISDDKFRELANAAKAGCPVSKVLNAEITLNARLNAQAA
ncbi:MAG: OsmC family protein [Acidobacteria bacterium]|nr:OsmC family protein [Acidobacteriota bacterium]